MTAAAGSISKAYDVIRNTIAASTTFQTWTGSADATEALNHIYKTDLPPPGSNAAQYAKAELVALRPFAIVFTDADNRHLKQSQADSAGWPRNHGTATIAFNDNIDSVDLSNPSEIVTKFENNVGQVIDDMWATSGQAGKLALLSTDYQGPVRADEDEAPTVGEYVAGYVTVSW